MESNSIPTVLLTLKEEDAFQYKKKNDVNYRLKKILYLIGKIY